MIKPIEKENIPGGTGKKTSQYRNDIADFLNSGFPCCEAFPDRSKLRGPVDSMVQGYRITAKKMGAPVEVIRRKNRIFIVRKEEK